MEAEERGGGKGREREYDKSCMASDRCLPAELLERTQGVAIKGLVSLALLSGRSAAHMELWAGKAVGTLGSSWSCAWDGSPIALLVYSTGKLPHGQVDGYGRYPQGWQVPTFLTFQAS